MANGPQHPSMMGPQGPPGGPGVPPGAAVPPGEMPPNAQQPLPMSGFPPVQPMGQPGYRGPPMPVQGPAMNRKFKNIHLYLYFFLQQDYA